MIYLQINCNAFLRLKNKKTLAESTLHGHELFPILKSSISTVHIYYVVVYMNIDIYDPKKIAKKNPFPRTLPQQNGVLRQYDTKEKLGGVI